MQEQSKTLIWSGVGIAALIFVCWFAAWKTNYNPNVVSTVITAIVAIVIGYVAALMGSQAALRATQQAHRNNLELQQQNQDALIKGILQAIYAELSELWKIYRAEFGEEWDNLKEGEGFWTHYPLTQNYFTVFEANSALIGQIPNAELRATIVYAYLRAKGLVDSHLLNNQLLAEHKRLRNSQSGGTDSVQEQIIKNAAAEIIGYGQGIRSAYNDARTAVLKTLELIERTGMLEGSQIVRREESKKITSL